MNVRPVIGILGRRTQNQGVNGLDSGCRDRGSGPRKATMISLTTRRTSN